MCHTVRSIGDGGRQGGQTWPPAHGRPRPTGQSAPLARPARPQLRDVCVCVCVCVLVPRRGAMPNQSSDRGRSRNGARGGTSGPRLWRGAGRPCGVPPPIVTVLLGGASESNSSRWCLLNEPRVRHRPRTAWYPKAATMQRRMACCASGRAPAGPTPSKDATPVPRIRCVVMRRHEKANPCTHKVTNDSSGRRRCIRGHTWSVYPRADTWKLSADEAASAWL